MVKNTEKESKNFHVLSENDETQPFMGRIVLDMLNMMIESNRRRLLPNLRFQEMPMIDMFRSTAYNK